MTRIKHKLKEIVEAIARIGLYIEAEKTELIHFPGYVLHGQGCKLAQLNSKPSIIINDGNGSVTVKPKECIRYLGFFFSSNLNWNTHIQFYFNRAFSMIHAFKMLGSSIRRLDTLQRQNAYQACILLVLSYGLPLWYVEDGQGMSCHLCLLAKVHSYAATWITGCFCTTPVGAKEMIAGMPPLALILNQWFHGYHARAATLLPEHILHSTMMNKWSNPAYSHVSPKTICQVTTPLNGYEQIWSKNSLTSTTKCNNWDYMSLTSSMTESSLTPHLPRNHRLTLRCGSRT